MSGQRILILCTGNSARSQMAEGILRSLDPGLEVFSAGTEPAARVHPAAVRAMNEIGIDISGATPKKVDQFLDQRFDHVITVCGDAEATCPAFRGAVAKRVHIGFDDPAKTVGRETDVLASFQRVRDEIRTRLTEYYKKEIRQIVMSETSMKEIVKEKYGEAARRVSKGGIATCGATSACCGGATEQVDPITGNLYAEHEKAALPEDAVKASLGCGNPTALAELRPGETVLDLGSGGGIDVLLSARRVAPGGKAYGLDMTDDMLALARENQRKSGVENVEFLKGEIESIPLPDNSVDVIISNCVINLSADKDRVLGEAFRVLRPGGRFAVSDVVTRGAIPANVRRSVELWVGCVAGALDEADYTAKLTRAGFEQVSIEPTRVYKVEDARGFLAADGIDVDAVAPLVDGNVFSAFLRARKPA